MTELKLAEDVCTDNKHTWLTAALLFCILSVKHAAKARDSLGPVCNDRTTNLGKEIQP